MEALLTEDRDFQEFVRKVDQKFGLDLASYKQAQVRRRLTSLRDRMGFLTFSEFFKKMTERPEVKKAFIDQLTINVTEFFRNADRWKFLSERVAPEILARKRRVKCWSAGCSTGEEPYTIVLSLMDGVGLPNVEVHATDLDPSVLEKAQRARYAALSVKEVAADKLQKYFRAEGREYILAEEIKKRVSFKSHNLLSDSYPTGFELIVCRNVLIYFTEEAKCDIYQKFSRSLHPGGYLFVGGTEQIVNPQKYDLSPVAPFFYRKVQRGLNS